MKAAFGVVIVCVALATVTQVRMATTVATSIAGHRDDFWIRIIRVFIFVLAFFVVGFLSGWLAPRFTKHPTGLARRIGLETSKSQSITPNFTAGHMML
jgi:predicted Na+-dependent transporter